MCGRFALSSPPQVLQDEFATQNQLDFSARYNLAPSQSVPVIQSVQGARALSLAIWGLMPSWAKDPDQLPHPINAKSETAATRPMFRHAYRHSRILVPADCFYEWKRVAGGKQPYLIRPIAGTPFAMGGILEHWSGPQGIVTTFAILTTAANSFMQAIHDRMPVIIPRDAFEEWLNPNITDPMETGQLCRPAPEGLLEAWPISTRINSPAHEGVELIQEVPLEA